MTQPAPLHELIRRIAHNVWQSTEPPAHFDTEMADALTPVIAELLSHQRKATARAWSAFLDIALTATDEEGFPIIELVFIHNPDLARRMKEALRQ